MASRPAEGYDEGPGGTGESVSRENGPLMRCVGRFWLVSGGEDTGLGTGFKSSVAFSRAGSRT